MMSILAYTFGPNSSDLNAEYVTADHIKDMANLASVTAVNATVLGLTNEPTPPLAAAPSPRSAEKISPGAAAGLGIAGALAGAVLTALFLRLWRRRRRTPPIYRPSAGRSVVGENTLSSVSQHTDNPHSFTKPRNSLSASNAPPPLPKSERVIAAGFSKSGAAIRNRA